MMLKLYQRGALLMAAVVLVVIIVAMVTAMSFLSVSNTTASGSHMSSAEAFYIANSGLERALYQIGKLGTNCTSLTNNNLAVGAGSFTTTGTVYPLAATTSTLSSAITAASTTIPFTVTAGVYTNYAPHGSILIESEEINYTSVSNSAAVCGTAPCFIGVTRGQNSTSPAAHSNGVALYQLSQCLIQSTGTAGAATRVMQAMVRTLSVQSGMVSMSTAVKTANISAVNPSKAFVVCNQDLGGSGGDPSMLVTCELTNPTTVAITAGNANNSENVWWYVVEFMSGVTVQRGLAPFGNSGGGPTSCTSGFSGGNCIINSVNLANSYILMSTHVLSTDTATDRDQDWAVRAAFQSATAVRFDRNQGATPALSPTVAWQVIQMNNASVQYLLPAISNGNLTSGPVTISPVVNTASSFVVFGRKAAATVSGIEAQYQTSCQLCTTATCSGNSNALTCTRAQSNTAVTIGAFVVAMSDATSVQNGNTSILNSNQDKNISISSIVINRSVPFLSVSYNVSGANSTTGLDQTTYSACFGNGADRACTTSTNNQLLFGSWQASAPNWNSLAAWSVVQFPAQVSVVDRGEFFP